MAVKNEDSQSTPVFEKTWGVNMPSFNNIINSEVGRIAITCVQVNEKNHTPDDIKRKVEAILVLLNTVSDKKHIEDNDIPLKLAEAIKYIDISAAAPAAAVLSKMFPKAYNLVEDNRIAHLYRVACIARMFSHESLTRIDASIEKIKRTMASM